MVVVPWAEDYGDRRRTAVHTMKVIFVIIGVVVIFGILISSGGIAGALCINGVGCVRTDSEGLRIDQSETVTVRAGGP